MKFLIVFAVAVGVAVGSPAGFLQNTPEVNAATQNFIREYNRLAQLAAEAPDIHIYHDDRRLQNIDQAPVRRAHNPVINPLTGQNFYSFTANLGGNQQFQPHQIRTIGQQTVHSVPVVRTHERQSTVATQKWTGPLAHSVPAGLNGAPVQVGFTPEVAAARNAHFQALVHAYQNAPSVHQRQ